MRTWGPGRDAPAQQEQAEAPRDDPQMDRVVRRYFWFYAISAAFFWLAVLGLAGMLVYWVVARVDPHMLGAIVLTALPVLVLVAAVSSLTAWGMKRRRPEGYWGHCAAILCMLVPTVWGIWFCIVALSRLHQSELNAYIFILLLTAVAFLFVFYATRRALQPRFRRALFGPGQMVCSQPLSKDATSGAQDATHAGLKCEWCGTKLSAPALLAGGTMSCPGCSAKVQLPTIQHDAARSGLAVLSLFCGFAGLLFCLSVLPSFVAIVCGMVAMKRGTSSKGMARWGVILGVLGISLHAVAWSQRFWPSFSDTPPVAHHSSTPDGLCERSLKRIAGAIETYKRMHSGAFPPDLEAMKLDGYLLPPPRCPYKKWNDPQADYAYAPPADSTPAAVMIACDGAARHRGGRIVLYVDGRTAILSDSQFATEIAQPQNRGLAEALAALNGKRDHPLQDATSTPSERREIP